MKMRNIQNFDRFSKRISESYEISESYSYPSGIYVEYGYEMGPDDGFIEAIFINARSDQEAKDLFLEALEVEESYLGSSRLSGMPFGPEFVREVLNDSYFRSEGWRKARFDVMELSVNPREPMGTFVKETVHNEGSSEEENSFFKNMTKQTFEKFFDTSGWNGPSLYFEDGGLSHSNFYKR